MEKEKMHAEGFEPSSDLTHQDLNLTPWTTRANMLLIEFHYT